MSCQLCEPAPHENCEVYTMVTIEDPAMQTEAHFDVCLEHYEAIQEGM